MPFRALPSVVFLGGLVAVAFTGCASSSHSPTTSPPAVPGRNGLSIAAVTYLAADTGKVRPNQIANTAPGEVLIEGQVDLALRKSLRQVLRRAGFDHDGPRRLLSAEITEFLIDDLGFGIDWTLRVRYTVRDGTGKPVCDVIKVTQRSTNKFMNSTSTLDDLLWLNAMDLVADDSFRKALR